MFTFFAAEKSKNKAKGRYLNFSRSIPAFISGIKNSYKILKYDFVPKSGIFAWEIGNKVYELKDHLGNVRSLIADYRAADGSGNPIAALEHYAHYYPFGMMQPGRSFNLGSYRYGHNGQESDAEILGSWGSHYTADYWMMDSRILRRWEPDPVVKPHESPYAIFANNPIWFMDPFGSDTSFASSTERDFVLDITNPESENYSKDYAEKFQTLVESETMYHFESFKHGEKKSESGSDISGVVYKATESDNQVNIAFTMGDDPLTKTKGLGRSTHGVLFEETFHAWDYETGGLNLDAPTCLNEAKAWKFASLAPGTKYTISTTWEGKQYTDYTVMYRIKNATDIQVATWFKTGMANYLDPKTNSEHFGVNAKKKKPDEPIKGYNPQNQK